MNKIIIIWSLTLWVGCAWQQDTSSAIIDVNGLEKLLLKSDQVQLLDVRPKEDYLTGHIPGAIQIWRDEIVNQQSAVQGLRLEKREFENLLSNKGFNARDSIYLYDAKGNVDAARVWWMLQYYGFKKVALVDGGYIAWKLAGKNTRSEMEIQRPETFVFIHENQGALLAEKEAISNGTYEQIIDARSTEEYLGETIKNGAFRPGHIPRAVHFDYINLLQPEDFRLKTKKEISALMEERNLRTNQKTAVYCHSGVRSALTTFALIEIMGMTEVSNYDGSWIEWSEDESLPIEPNTEKPLL